MKNITIITLLLALLLLVNCEDNFPDELPPITTTGENTFGALMNGEVYVPNGGLLQFAIDFDFPTKDNNYQFLIKTTRTSKESTLKDSRLRIWQTETKDVGIYNLFEASAEYRGIRYQNSEEYDTLSNRECGNLIGTLEIMRLDTINKIISGTFDIAMVKSDQPYDNCLEITSGRFDLQK
ncbi:MAG: hypothetical protein RIG77_17445 [Cyclobacteriaceae bacterium]